MRSMFLVCALFTALIGCGGSPSEEAPGDVVEQVDNRIVVYTVNYPLAYFAERIGGEAVEVHFPAPAGIDPAYWVPDAETMAAYQGADLILLNGAGYAGWVKVASLPASVLVDTSASFMDRLISKEGEVTHSHGPEGEHAHADLAFTTWLDPTLAIEQARAVAEALVKLRPDSELQFERALSALEGELTALDQRLLTAAEALQGSTVVFSHPVFEYLIRRYALEGVSLHWEPDEMPGPEAWRELGEIVNTRPVRSMLWEGQPVAEIAHELESRGVPFAVFEPCGNRPAMGDFMTTMENNAAVLAGQEDSRGRRDQ